MTKQQAKDAKREQQRQQLFANDNDAPPSGQWTVWDALAVWGANGLPHNRCHERPKREIRIPQSAA